MAELFEIISTRSPKVLGFTLAAVVLAVWWLYSRWFAGPREDATPGQPVRPRRRVDLVLAGEAVPGVGSSSEASEYDRLIPRFPDEPGLLYNRGAALQEAGRYRESSETFLTLLDRLLPVPDLTPGRQGGGLAGILSGHSDPPPLPALALDIEAYLKQIEPSLKKDTAVLHGLATLSRLQDRYDDAVDYYKRILETDPDDEVARIYRDLLDDGSPEAQLQQATAVHKA